VMNRPIVAFHKDCDSQWVAELACGHRRHTRHNPPLSERPWVLTSEGRQSQIGAEIECVQCDRRAMPPGYAPYRRTALFDEKTLPEALRRDHATKSGVWARIEVTRGSIDYFLHAPFHSCERLTPQSPGVVPPEVRHHLAASGPVSLFVEFWRPGDAYD
jgi:tellurite methyltransferase